MSIEDFKDANDELISDLSYKSPNSASFLKTRNSCSFQAVGGHVDSPGSGARVIRFSLNSEDFLVVNSLRIQF